MWSRSGLRRFTDWSNEEKIANYKFSDKNRRHSWRLCLAARLIFIDVLLNFTHYSIEYSNLLSSEWVSFLSNKFCHNDVIKVSKTIKSIAFAPDLDLMQFWLARAVPIGRGVQKITLILHFLDHCIEISNITFVRVYIWRYCVSYVYHYKEADLEQQRQVSECISKFIF